MQLISALITTSFGRSGARTTTSAVRSYYGNTAAFSGCGLRNNQSLSSLIPVPAIPHTQFGRAFLKTMTQPSITSTPSTTSNPPNTNPYKRVKLESNPPPSHLAISNKVIRTHSGTFQADEALGVWLLRQTPAYYRAGVIIAPATRGAGK
mmetsp:Transcript_30825/g.35578  ORF Transcript_30825/g.35578 Transcript_30825/m.35578 type:complete len:150 (-) Transcript_30825:293-742(-)